MDNKLTKLEFMAFAKHFANKMSDSEASDLFIFLLRKDK